MSRLPSVTVVMPAHNTERWIGPAIQSVLNQDFTDFELWVLENGSTDGTAGIAREFNDPRVKVLQLGPVGFQGALTYALENARSEWLARMDSDDLCLPNRLSAQLAVAKSKKELCMVGTAYAFLTPFGHVIERLHGQPSRPLTKPAVAMGGCRPQFPKARFFADPSVLFRRDVAIEAGGYDSDFTMGDVPLWLRMLERGAGWELAECLYLYRLLPTSFSTTHSEGPIVRAKYAKEQVPAYSAIFGKSASESDKAPKGKNYVGYWRKLGFLELLAVDRGTVSFCIETLLALGDKAGAGVLRRRLRLQKICLGVYTLRHCRNYRRRLDIEKKIGDLSTNADGRSFIQPDIERELGAKAVRRLGLVPNVI